VSADGIVLRAARNADADAIVDVLRASRFAFLPFAPPAHTAEEDRAWTRSTLLPTCEVTVAQAPPEGVLVGALATRAGDDGAWIEQLYLRPGWTGRRLGTRLLRHALARLPRPVRLFTFQQNEGARRFYEAAGFRPERFSDGRDNEERCPDVLYRLDHQGRDRP
jgi:ribosomal protein S18 acetylase RimI-like enzyme